MIEEIYNEVVPNRVDRETFWCRYFYWVCKIKKAEEARARLVNKRSISVEEEKEEEEDEFSSDVDDDDYEEIDGSKLMNNSKQKAGEKYSSEKIVVERSTIESEEKSLKQEEDKGVVSESKSDNGVNERVHLDDGSESSGSMSKARSDELDSERKTENGGSCKDSDFFDVSSQPSLVPEEEEDFGWDKIEDIDSICTGAKYPMLFVLLGLKLLVTASNLASQKRRTDSRALDATWPHAIGPLVVDQSPPRICHR
ncbi:hypothetical protein HYC85_020326 [Camellia sinensis]|uniref:BSD domain-containing protein n=1 Tax=Camellia sinensis TaxID=4442 RepID=A0A7J7GT99_CAMSI|nr:hypothetical protein HYC85_020326 [Camellia sinensis]